MPQISSSLYRRLKTPASSAIHSLAHIRRSISDTPPPRLSSSSYTLHAKVSSRIGIPARPGHSHLARLLCVLIFFSHALPTQATPPLSSADVEAAYLYNFGKFIQWPASADASPTPFSICIFGKDDFGATLDSLVHNDTVNGRAIVARRLPSIAVVDACQILFLGSSEQPHLDKDLDALKDKPILTVSNMNGFLDHGGMIQFLVRDSRVRFAVNLASATRVHLTLSSELLKVAVFVESKPSREGE